MAGLGVGRRVLGALVIMIAVVALPAPPAEAFVAKGAMELEGNASTSRVRSNGSNSGYLLCSLSGYAYATAVDGFVKVSLQPADASCGSHKLPATNSSVGLTYKVTYVDYGFYNGTVNRLCQYNGAHESTIVLGDITVNSQGYGSGTYRIPGVHPVQNGNPWEASVCVSDSKYSPSIYGIHAPLAIIAPSVSFSESEVPANWEIAGTVTGSGFAPGATYDIRWHVPSADPPIQYSVRTVTADGNGSFNATINVDNTGSPPGGSSSATAYVHVFHSTDSCVATANVLLSVSRVASPIEEILPAKDLPGGAIVRTGEQSPTDPHDGWGRVHVDTARKAEGGWSGVYQRTRDTLANPDAGYPRAQGHANKYMKGGWVVIIERQRLDPVDGKMRGLITSRPAKPGEV